MTAPAGIIFDLDDTLYDYRQYRRSGFRAVAQYLESRVGMAAEPLCARLSEIDASGPVYHPGVIDELFRILGLPRDLLKESVEVFRNHDPEIRLFPGVMEMLKELAQRYAIPLFLITEGPYTSQWKKIQALCIQDLFSRIYVLAPPLRHKKQTETYEEIRSFLAVPSSSIWVIGDNPDKDFFIPSAMGMKMVQVTRDQGSGGLSRTADLLRWLELTGPEEGCRACTAIG
ncbi:MAG: HAD family hydrolase [Deltaproteobacteria bacterium]|nr:HAD family hydrolase [Deltaproteobacteria bacterium]